MISPYYRANQTVKRMSIFIGQPIYSLKNICLGGDTVEKPVIFEGQEDVLLKRGAWKAKSESSTASIQRLSPLGMPFLTFIGQQCASLLTPRSSQMCLLFLVRPTRGRSMGDVLSPQSFGLRPPTGGYDSSDLLRRSQTMCIRNMRLMQKSTGSQSCKIVQTLQKE